MLDSPVDTLDANQGVVVFSFIGDTGLRIGLLSGVPDSSIVRSSHLENAWSFSPEE